MACTGHCDQEHKRYKQTDGWVNVLRAQGSYFYPLNVE